MENSLFLKLDAESSKKMLILLQEGSLVHILCLNSLSVDMLFSHLYVHHPETQITFFYNRGDRYIHNSVIRVGNLFSTYVASQKCF